MPIHLWKKDHRGIIMDEVMGIWPIISGVIMIAAVAIAFRAEILVRVRVLEEKVQTLFELFNKK